MFGYSGALPYIRKTLGYFHIMLINFYGFIKKRRKQYNYGFVSGLIDHQQFVALRWILKRDRDTLLVSTDMYLLSKYCDFKMLQWYVKLHQPHHYDLHLLDGAIHSHVESLKKVIWLCDRQDPSDYTRLLRVAQQVTVSKETYTWIKSKCDLTCPRCNSRLVVSYLGSDEGISDEGITQVIMCSNAFLCTYKLRV